jgi:hypothetical protein
VPGSLGAGEKGQRAREETELCRGTTYSGLRSGGLQTARAR